MELQDRITERIALLTKERDTFLEEANKKLVAYESAISELQHLLEPPHTHEGENGTTN